MRFAYRHIGGVVTEIEGRLRSNVLDTTIAAEEGATPIYRVEIDNPTGAFDITGHRLFAIWDDECVDPDDQYLAVGYVQRRRYRRGDGDLAIGPANVIEADIADLNTILGRRVMTGSDADRPAETDVERMQWAVLTNEASLIDDDTYLSTANPVDMDACDYRGQYLMNVLEDCAEASGKNYFVTWLGPAFEEDGIESPWGTFSIFYDFSGGEAWSSDLFLTNDGAEVIARPEEVFIITSAELLRSPDRVYSGIYLPFDGGYSYGQDADTVADFARRDAIMPSLNVKSQTKANARRDRYLEDLDEEDDRLTISYLMKPADVNRLRAGMRVPVKFEHLPGYEGWRWCRMLTRSVRRTETETGATIYAVSGEFSGTPVVLSDPPGGPVEPPPDPGDPNYLGTLMVEIITGSGNNSEIQYGNDGTGPGTLQLYDDCTYRFDFTVAHSSTAERGSHYLESYLEDHGNPPINFGSMKLGTAFNNATYTRPPYSGDHVLHKTHLVLNHTPYFLYNGITSTAQCVVSYVSGPDERFP